MATKLTALIVCSVTIYLQVWVLLIILIDPIGRNIVKVRSARLQRLRCCSLLTQTRLVWVSSLVNLGWILLRTCMLRFGFGNGRWQITLCGRFSLILTCCILLPNSLCSGLMSLSVTCLGSLLMPRRSPTMRVPLAPELVDLTMLGQTAFRVSYPMFLSPPDLLLKTLMNRCLTTPCPVLGLLMFVSVVKQCVVVLIWTMPMFTRLVTAVTIRLFLR